MRLQLQSLQRRSPHRPPQARAVSTNLPGDLPEEERKQLLRDVKQLVETSLTPLPSVRVEITLPHTAELENIMELSNFLLRLGNRWDCQVILILTPTPNRSRQP